MVEAPEEEETLYYPTERDYRDMRADEAWEPTEPQPSQAAPKAFPKAFQAAGPPPGHEGQGAGRLGVYITKYGQEIPCVQQVSNPDILAAEGIASMPSVHA